MSETMDLETRRALGREAKDAGMPTPIRVFTFGPDYDRLTGEDVPRVWQSVKYAYLDPECPSFIGHAIAELERRTGGDVWVEPVYDQGDGSRVVFIANSRRASGRNGVAHVIGTGSTRPAALVEALKGTRT